MLLYIMRHGIAAERDEVKFPDDALRPLTSEGFKKTRAAARGMRKLKINLDLLITSPLVRAKQTASVVAEELRVDPSRIRESANLEPDADAGAILRELAEGHPLDAVLLVGHEPHVSRLLVRCIAGSERALHIPFKKAALAQVEVDPHSTRPRGQLMFLLTPKQLRMVGESRL
ncbi:MAG: phosphohistidine phosphatase SixA [Phycisphaerae bacterium]